jgi:nitrate reductase gamma subunit
MKKKYRHKPPLILQLVQDLQLIEQNHFLFDIYAFHYCEYSKLNSINSFPNKYHLIKFYL